MRKILLFCAMALVAVLLVSCESRQTAAGVCRIHGTISNQYDGKRIFLVPLVGPATAANVDSVEIKGGRFEFATDTQMMGKILVDYHYRMGVQPLLVVVEPGDVVVSIDSISHAKGTPQNDSLEKWKVVTELNNREVVLLRRAGKGAEADSVRLNYKHYTRQLAARMEKGLLHDFLDGLFPLTYKKKMPDGRTVTLNADTHEEVR